MWLTLTALLTTFCPPSTVPSRRTEHPAVNFRIQLCSDNSECEAPQRCDCPFLGLLFCCDVPGYPTPIPRPIPIPVDIASSEEISMK